MYLIFFFSHYYFVHHYCGAREFAAQAHSTLGPKAQAEESHCRGRIMKSQKEHKDIAEDDLMLSTSQNA